MTMLSINTNVGALQAARSSYSVNKSMEQSMERLASGKRVNGAADDAAGLAIATRLNAEINGINQGIRNASDAQGMLDTADGALAEVQTLLLRMRELAVQSSNDTVTASDRDAMQAEVQALEDEIQRIGDNTTWGGQKILDGSYSTVAKAKFHIGAGAGENIEVDFGALSHSAADSSKGGLGLTSHVSTQSAASAYLTDIDQAISIVSAKRGEFGAMSNRLNSTISNLDQIQVNLSASKGRIADTDFASETANLARHQIMQQAATAMIAQANASKSAVLTLVR